MTRQSAISMGLERKMSSSQSKDENTGTGGDGAHTILKNNNRETAQTYAKKKGKGYKKQN